MGMADMSMVKEVSMTVAVAISTPALAIARSMITMVYPITRRSNPIVHI
jgi:hypothetical protein